MEAITGKELLVRTFKHEKGLPRVPWVPFAGVHAGKLKGYSAIEVLTDGKKLLESLMEVNGLYRPDGQPVLFDLQVEAEILGCELVWAQKAPPSVKTHPLASEKTIPRHLPKKTEGRLPMILDVMKRFKAQVGQTTALFGLICGPLTLASHLRSTELFMDMFMDPDYVHQLIRYTSGTSAYSIHQRGSQKDGRILSGSRYGYYRNCRSSGFPDLSPALCTVFIRAHC